MLRPIIISFANSNSFLSLFVSLPPPSVINLSPDKPQVFREIHRILRKGGRVAVSDVVIRPQKMIPDHLKTAEALAC